GDIRHVAVSEHTALRWRQVRVGQPEWPLGPPSAEEQCPPPCLLAHDPSCRAQMEHRPSCSICRGCKGFVGASADPRKQGNMVLWGYGFHEDGLKAGKSAAQSLLGQKSSLLLNPKQMVPSWTETGARLLVTRFLNQYVTIGNMTILEEGGTMFSFGEVDKKCLVKTVLRVATEADLGMADAYINGYFSFVDKREGLLNLFLSNDFFSIFLDPSMTYSCAVFKVEDESLEVAQQRKVNLLIKKAKVERNHHVLEIGSGWGSLAMEVVKQTGCKYTGITLSEEQLKYAQMKVKEAGLEDRITFLLCDYRQIPSRCKYDRIISCEMIEGVGHEFMDDFFGCCESLLAPDGLFVLQFISIPEERYEEYRRSSDFIKEYIFPGGCLPSLARITSAMSTASRLWYASSRLRTSGTITTRR
uniref:Cyclopropane-fatty-acyl-phospholipid synthase n=1 Tax=Aegilops tauschii subsp. strangulata TaxID=200361 RepID=A0A453ACY3_AEGTS